MSPVVHGTTLVTGLSTVEARLEAMGRDTRLAAALLQVCAACAQLDPDSAFVSQLNAGGITVPGVVYTQIVTRFDEVVVPYTNGIVEGPDSTNITVQDQCALDFADHVSLDVDPIAAQDVLNALDPANPGAVPCQLVLPFIGCPDVRSPCLGPAAARAESELAVVVGEQAGSDAVAP